MKNRNRKILAIALSVSMIFNGAVSKNRKDIYLPKEPMTLESSLKEDKKYRKLKKICK